MGLAAADDHRTDLRQLTGRAAETVGLGIEGDELERGERAVEGEHRQVISAGPDGLQTAVQNPRPGPGGDPAQRPRTPVRVAL